MTANVQFGVLKRSMLCLYKDCGKRPAVVFVSNNNSKDAPTAGYCLTCAKELGIKPVEDLISKMGISDEDLKCSGSDEHPHEQYG